MFNTLMRKDEHLDYVPELATPQVSPDGLSVTFTLHDNVKFHDGKPLTSADVKYTYEKLFTIDSPKAASFLVRGLRLPGALSSAMTNASDLFLLQPATDASEIAASNRRDVVRIKRVLIRFCLRRCS